MRRRALRLALAAALLLAAGAAAATLGIRSGPLSVYASPFRLDLEPLAATVELTPETLRRAGGGGGDEDDDDDDDDGGGGDEDDDGGGGGDEDEDDDGGGGGRVTAHISLPGELSEEIRSDSVLLCRGSEPCVTGVPALRTQRTGPGRWIAQFDRGAVLALVADVATPATVRFTVSGFLAAPPVLFAGSDEIRIVG